MSETTSWSRHTCAARRQGKIEEIQSGKKDLADRVEVLRTVKETAEQPEKEAKERHLKTWEGTSSDSMQSCLPPTV